MPGDIRDDSGGPYLATAVLCERVLQEKDGVLSLIRIVDRWTHTLTGEDAPREMPPVPINVWAVISFKSGKARGGANVEIWIEEPLGMKKRGPSLPIFFEGEDRGHSIVMQVNFVAERDGLYWFVIYLDGQFVTKMPLRVLYQRLAIGA